jgi:hypothetical protein
MTASLRYNGNFSNAGLSGVVQESRTSNQEGAGDRLRGGVLWTLVVSRPLCPNDLRDGEERDADTFFVSKALVSCSTRAISRPASNGPRI